MQNVALLQSVQRRLDGLGVDPPASPELAQSFADNIASMIDDAKHRYVMGDHGSVVSDVLLADEDLATGALHAEHLQHPAGPILAAEVLFDEYLPTFVAEVGASAPEEVLAAARALHAGVWSRFPAGAVAYTEALRQRVTTANLDSRTQIARDLHDRIAHGVLVGLQRIDLVVMTAPLDDEQADRLRSAADLLRRALRDVQDLAVSLHARVGDRHLDDALGQHAAELFGLDSGLTVSSTGTPRRLANWRAEEALTITLEALVNWRKHAPRSTARTEFTWNTHSVLVVVQDDGPGFDEVEGVDGRLGLRTMRERAALIGARFAVESSRGRGTTVRLELPYGVH